VPSPDPLILPAVETPLLNRDDESHDVTPEEPKAEPASSDGVEADLDLSKLDNAPATEDPPAAPEPLAPTPAPALDSTVPTAEPESLTSPTGDAPESVDDARKLVEDALNSGPTTELQQPIEALGAQHVDLGQAADSTAPAETAPPMAEPPVLQAQADTPPPAGLPTMPVTDVDPLSSATGVQATEVPPEAAPPAENPPVSMSPADQPMTMPLPPSLAMPPANDTPPTSPSTDNPQGPPPPPVPPPPPMPFVNPNQ
jgi:hypothetical protein